MAVRGKEAAEFAGVEERAGGVGFEEGGVRLMGRPARRFCATSIWSLRPNRKAYSCVQASGVLGIGFGVWGLGFGVWGLGFGVWGLGFRVQTSLSRGVCSAAHLKRNLAIAVTVHLAA